MSDIVERLRGRADRYRQLWGNAAYYTDGDALFDEKTADTITTLRADLQKLNERNAEYIGTIDRLRRRVAETDVEIERLSEANTQVWAYNERLRAALWAFVNAVGSRPEMSIDDAKSKALAALAEEKKDDL